MLPEIASTGAGGGACLPGGSLARAGLLLCFGVAISAAPLAGQADEQPKTDSTTRWEVTGLPVLTFNSDEGLVYGAVMQLYQYGRTDQQPYLLTIRPSLYLTSKGRRDLTVFFDSPHLSSSGWRIDALVGSQKQIATPYYGVGNGTTYDALQEEEPNPYYYRFGRTRRSVVVNVQKRVGELPLRILLGVGASNVNVVTVPEDSGTTLLHQEMARGDWAPDGWANSIRIGVVWDTRDRETGPRSGAWTDVLVQQVAERLGGDWSFTRWTLTDRRYYTPTRRLTIANRLLLQNISGNPPFHEMQWVQSSFEQKEGMGGDATVRGVLRNRYTGKGLFLWNLEARFRLWDWSGFGRDFHGVISGFVDSGRVWTDGIRVGELFTGLHRGMGIGIRVGMGENFLVSLDGAKGDEVGVQLYTGMGYLF